MPTDADAIRDTLDLPRGPACLPAGHHYPQRERTVPRVTPPPLPTCYRLPAGMTPDKPQLLPYRAYHDIGVGVQFYTYAAA